MIMVDAHIDLCKFNLMTSWPRPPTGTRVRLLNKMAAGNNKNPFDDDEDEEEEEDFAESPPLIMQSTLKDEPGLPGDTEEKTKKFEEVASWLLSEGLILTSLELHTELLESGRQIQQLKDYFSNPGNFETAIPQPLKSDLCMFNH